MTTNTTVRVLYLLYEGGTSVITFPNQDLASEWLIDTRRLKNSMDDIVEQSRTENEGLTRVVEWLNYYVDHYLMRWGSDIVAPDVRNAAEVSNAELPEQHRVTIPADVTGTVGDGCTCTMRRRTSGSGN